MLDTAGNELYEALFEALIRDSQAVLFVYSVVSPPSLEQIFMLKSQVVRVKGRDNTPLMLVGSKCDLEETRTVSTAVARDVADAVGASYMEVSAKTGCNVENAFFDLIREMRRCVAAESGMPGCLIS